jgi:large subunit ribosomal protein L19e
MNLGMKKVLAAKVLGVGKDRIIFVPQSLGEIKEAITRQDISDLHKSGAILIREERGRLKTVKRKHRRGIGKVKKKAINKKRVYMTLTRKLRASAMGLLRMKKINKDQYRNIRKMVRASRFKSRRHLMESLHEI